MTTVIVVGVVGYGYIWWKGWKISDMMFVTRRGFSDACKSVGKQLDMVSSSVASAKSHLSLRIDHVGNNIDECKELAAATKDEVSSLHGDLSEFHEDVESVRCVVQTLETKLVRIEENQGFATEGVYRMCKFAEKLEPGRNPELIQIKSGTSSIEQISRRYGKQAVVVSIDPRKVYLRSPDQAKFKAVKLTTPGPLGEGYAWYQCTVSGGREGRPIGACELSKSVAELGAGEILLNCIDCDGQGQGFD